MAYNYFQLPQMYPPNFQNSSNIYWVQGIESAKAYPVGAGNSILLMDSDNSAFYIKTADQSGVPSLRAFDYTERTGEKHVDLAAYVTREEFNEFVTKLSTTTEKKKKKKKEDDEEDED